MKKYAALIALSMLVLTACGGETSSPVDTSSSGGNTSESTSYSDDSSETIFSDEPGSSDGGSSDTGSSSSDDSSTGDDSSSGGSSSTDPSEEEFTIYLPSDSRYTITVDKTTAKKGELVSGTVSASAGYEVTAVLVNGSAATMNGNSFAFYMPSNDVRLTAQLSVSGKVTINGDIAAPLVLDEDAGIYVARDVEVANDSIFSYFIEDDNGNTTELNIQNVDRTKCFGNISYSFGTSYRLEIAGGAKYDFYYDPANGDRPCYVKRTEVTALPSSRITLQNLFDSNVQSDPACYPENVNGVKYTNTESDVSYTWTQYDNNTSYASVKKLSNGADVGEVYKSLDGDIYTVVDTYIEGNDDSTRRDDTSKFSGKYLVADYEDNGRECDDQEFESNRQFVKENIAEFDANLYSHDMTSIDFDIMYAYRVGMTVEYEYTQASLNVSSVQNSDGGFTTTVISSSTYDETAVSYDTGTDQRHDEYEVHLTFDKAGALISGDYKDTRYEGDEFDFYNFTITAGAEGEVVKELAFEYSYGDPVSSSELSYDTSSYFISSLNPTFNDSKAGDGNVLNSGDNPEDYMELNYAPETALDSWQYGVQSSSDTNVILYDSLYSRWASPGTGTTKLTVSNKTTKSPSVDVDVQVIYNYKIRNFNMYLVYGYDGYASDDWVADQANVYEGHISRYVLGCYGNNGEGSIRIPGDVTFSLSEEIQGLDIYTAPSNYAPSVYTDIVFDATEMVVPTDGMSVTLTVHSSYYGDGVSETTFKIYLWQTVYTRESIVGTWECEEKYASVTFTNNTVSTDASYYSDSAPYAGTLTVRGTTYNFGYDFIETSIMHEITLNFESVAGEYYSSYCYYAEGYTDGSTTYDEAIELGVCIESIGVSDDGWTSETNELLGSIYDDEEGYTYWYELDEFVRA